MNQPRKVFNVVYLGMRLLRGKAEEILCPNPDIFCLIKTTGAGGMGSVGTELAV